MEFRSITERRQRVVTIHYLKRGKGNASVSDLLLAEVLTNVTMNHVNKG